MKGWSNGPGARLPNFKEKRITQDKTLMLRLENLIVINKYASFNSGKEISALESKFVNLLSTLASYVKSKCQGLVHLILSKKKMLLSSSVNCRGT